MLLYLILGHSHMVADCVVAWCKGTIKSSNFYFPLNIAKMCDKVKGVSPKFLDHINSRRPFYVRWESIMDKYFKSLPTGFTNYYLFKIDEGIVTMKHLAYLPKSESVCIPMILPGRAATIYFVLLKELFG